jgi:hypothetical protein
MKICRSVFLSLLFFFSFFSAAQAQMETAVPSAEELIQKVELRRGTWTGFKASIEIEFISASGKQAGCHGNLVYQRLDEKVFLECFNEKEKRVFVLKTTDREFELYLPGHKTLYKGNIFTLEDSPAIESHIRAWDLYRAFKPLAIPSENLLTAPAENGLTALNVMRNETVPSRELKISKAGDIVNEVYYSLTGKKSAEIQRSEFQEIGASVSGVATAYPCHIKIVSYKENGDSRETIFKFKSADFLADLSDADFQTEFPPNTKVMELEDSF